MESHLRQLASEREACAKMTRDANQRAVEMELAAQRLVTEAEMTSTQRITEIEARFAEECESQEQNVRLQIFSFLRLAL